MNHFVRLFLCFVIALASCQVPQQSAKVTRSECMRIAESYVSHRWHPTPANVRHGLDRTGIRVDTPDISYQKPGAVTGWWKPNTWNSGMPYQWGGFATLADFDRSIAAGAAGGDVYTSDKRRLLDAAVSSEATGIDCSGFISRCWGLSKSYSTRELPRLCDALATWDALQPGDILNTWNAHVFLFAGWTDERRNCLTAYESGRPPHWKVVRTTLSTESLKTQGFKPWRYRGMAD